MHSIHLTLPTEISPDDCQTFMHINFLAIVGGNLGEHWKKQVLRKILGAI